MPYLETDRRTLAKSIRCLADSWAQKRRFSFRTYASHHSGDGDANSAKDPQEQPEAATHWSTRSMAEAIGVGKDTVRRVWAAHGLKPHSTRHVSQR